MNIRRFCLCFAAAALSVPRLLSAVQPSVTDVSAAQNPSTRRVEVSYRVSDPDSADVAVRAEFSADGGKTWTVPASAFTGDIGSSVRADGALRKFVWDAVNDWNLQYTDRMQVRLTANDRSVIPGSDGTAPYWSETVRSASFVMGPVGPNEPDGPHTEVSIPYHYELGRCEVTNAAYAEFLSAALADGLAEYDPELKMICATLAAGTYGVSNTPLCPVGPQRDITFSGTAAAPAPGKEHFPADVYWQGALLFCRYYGYDLPTDAEWEMAARGPDAGYSHTRFPWGNDPHSPCISPSYAVGPVGAFAPSHYGLYDMAGNAEEWTCSRDLPLVTDDLPDGRMSGRYPTVGLIDPPDPAVESPDLPMHSDAAGGRWANSAPTLDFRIVRGRSAEPICLRVPRPVAARKGNLGALAGFRPVRRISLSGSVSKTPRPDRTETILSEDFQTWSEYSRNTWVTDNTPWTIPYGGNFVRESLNGIEVVAVRPVLEVRFPDLPAFKAPHLRNKRLRCTVVNRLKNESATLFLLDADGGCTHAELPPDSTQTVTLQVPPGNLYALRISPRNSIDIRSVELLQQPAAGASAEATDGIPHLTETFTEGSGSFNNGSGFATPLGVWKCTQGTVTPRYAVRHPDTTVLRLEDVVFLSTPELVDCPTAVTLSLRNRDPNGCIELRGGDSGTLLASATLTQDSLPQTVTLTLPSDIRSDWNGPYRFTLRFFCANGGADLTSVRFRFENFLPSSPVPYRPTLQFGAPDRPETLTSFRVTEQAAVDMPMMRVRLRNPSPAETLRLRLINGTGTLSAFAVPPTPDGADDVILAFPLHRRTPGVREPLTVVGDRPFVLNGYTVCEPEDDAHGYGIFETFAGCQSINADDTFVSPFSGLWRRTGMEGIPIRGRELRAGYLSDGSPCQSFILLTGTAGGNNAGRLYLPRLTRPPKALTFTFRHGLSATLQTARLRAGICYWGLDNFPYSRVASFSVPEVPSGDGSFRVMTDHIDISRPAYLLFESALGRQTVALTGVGFVFDTPVSGSPFAALPPEVAAEPAAERPVPAADDPNPLTLTRTAQPRLPLPETLFTLGARGAEALLVCNIRNRGNTPASVILSYDGPFAAPAGIGVYSARNTVPPTGDTPVTVALKLPSRLETSLLSHTDLPPLRLWTPDRNAVLTVSDIRFCAVASPYRYNSTDYKYDADAAPGTPEWSKGTETFDDTSVPHNEYLNAWQIMNGKVLPNGGPDGSACLRLTHGGSLLLPPLERAPGDLLGLRIAYRLPQAGYLLLHKLSYYNWYSPEKFDRILSAVRVEPTGDSWGSAEIPFRPYSVRYDAIHCRFAVTFVYEKEPAPGTAPDISLDNAELWFSTDAPCLPPGEFASRERLFRSYSTDFIGMDTPESWSDLKNEGWTPQRTPDMPTDPPTLRPHTFYPFSYITGYNAITRRHTDSVLPTPPWQPGYGDRAGIIRLKYAAPNAIGPTEDRIALSVRENRPGGTVYPWMYGITARNAGLQTVTLPFGPGHDTPPVVAFTPWENKLPYSFMTRYVTDVEIYHLRPTGLPEEPGIIPITPTYPFNETAVYDTASLSPASGAFLGSAAPERTATAAVPPEPAETDANRADAAPCGTTASAHAPLPTVHCGTAAPCGATASAHYPLSTVRYPLSTVPCGVAASAFFTCDTGGKTFDSDADGIPDWWELIHCGDMTAMDPTADTDGDGQTNYEEFVQNTDPDSAASSLALRLDPNPGPNADFGSGSFTAALQEEGPFVLSWQAMPGRTYTVRAAETPNGPWTDLRTLPGRAGRLSAVIPFATPARFFRVRIEPTP